MSYSTRAPKKATWLGRMFSKDESKCTYTSVVDEFLASPPPTPAAQLPAVHHEEQKQTPLYVSPIKEMLASPLPLPQATQLPAQKTKKRKEKQTTTYVSPVNKLLATPLPIQRAATDPWGKTEYSPYASQAPPLVAPPTTSSNLISFPTPHFGFCHGPDTSADRESTDSLYSSEEDSEVGTSTSSHHHQTILAEPDRFRRGTVASQAADYQNFTSSTMVPYQSLVPPFPIEHAANAVALPPNQNVYQQDHSGLAYPAESGMMIHGPAPYFPNPTFGDSSWAR